MRLGGVAATRPEGEFRAWCVGACCSPRVGFGSSTAAPGGGRGEGGAV